jgi:ssDNA-binding Zn-finger/Zn-ribbon topoisomerase 1
MKTKRRLEEEKRIMEDRKRMSKVKVKLEMMPCVKCGSDMPVLRKVKYGYNFCVNCSTTEKMGGVAIANHKTGNEIQIVPMDVANNINRLAARSGYGVCKGMKHN